MVTTRKKIIKHDSVNLLPLVDRSITYNNLTYTANSNNGTIIMNGTPTSQASMNLCTVSLKAGTYTLTAYGLTENGFGIYLSTEGYGRTQIANIYHSTNKYASVFTLSEDSVVYCWISANTSLSYENHVVEPMLLRGDMTSNLPPFEPYYNHKTIYKTYTRTDNLIKTTDWYSQISGLTITQKPNDSNTVTIAGTSNRGAMAIANKNFYTADMLGKTITFSQSKKFTAWNDPAAIFWQIWRDGSVYKTTSTSSQTITFEEGHTWGINVWMGVAGEKNYTISFWANEGTVAKPFQPYSTVTYKKHIVERT